MIESSDLQAAIQRTQMAERIQQLQSQQEEVNRKRFELEMARERAETEKKVKDSPKTEHKKVIRDKYEGEEGEEKQSSAQPETAEDEEEARDESPEDQDPPEPPGGHLDVRV